MSNPEQAVAQQVLVRSAAVRDFWDIMRIENMCFSAPWPEAAMWEDLTQLGEGKVYLVVEVDGKLVGYIGAHCFAGEAHIVTLAVAPDCRRMGLGELLVLTLVELVTSRGAEYVTLEYRVSNRAAERLYSKLGFMPAGVRRHYYPDTDEDAVVTDMSDLQQPQRQADLARLAADWRKRHRYDLHMRI